jgi:fructoselysine-6-phosphate deglycase
MKGPQVLDFDLETHLANTRSLLALRGQIEEAAQRIVDGPYKNLYFIGAGGTYSAALPYERLFQTHSSWPVRAVVGKEFILAPDPGFGPESVAVFASDSGTTPDIVECIAYAKEAGAATLAFTGRPETPIAQDVDEVFLSDAGAWPMDIPFLLLSAAILHKRGEFDGYDRLVKDLEAMPEALASVREQVDAQAEQWAKDHGRNDYHFLVGSGYIWGLTYLFSMCILEEMQWLKTTRVQGAEFFHGSLELIEKDTSLILFKGEDETRPVIDRVERFAEQVSDDVLVLDSKNFELPGVSDEFRGLLGPQILHAASGRFSRHLSVVRDHPLTTRRYYRQMAY